MIIDLVVENFRLFKRIEIPDLSKVNLFVGFNNSGKSALLEAILLYASNVSPLILIDLISKRQETWLNDVEAAHSQTTSPLRHLFYNHSIPPIGEGILVGPLNVPNNQILLGVGAYRLEETPEGVLRRILLKKDMITDDTDYEFALVSVEHNKTRRILSLDRDIVSERRGLQRRLAMNPLVPKYVTQFVPTTNMSETKIAELWDAINLTGLDAEVVTGLQLMEPKITGIAFVEDRRVGSVRIPVVKLSSVAEPLPLRSLGDGIIRLFHIAVALVNAKDGILLIDEFENGLHWSVQSKVWEMVFRLGKDLNVQIFASTHSRDCIHGFSSAWGGNENDGRFYRINPSKDGAVSVTKYNMGTLSDALETNVEVR